MTLETIEAIRQSRQVVSIRVVLPLAPVETRPKPGSVLSEPSSGLSPQSLPVSRYAYNPLPIDLRQSHVQETVTVRHKIESLLPRIIALEARFGSRPDDVEDQRRRRELIKYASMPS